MSADFSHLKKFALANTAVYLFDQLGAKLTVRFAGESNTALFNTRMRKQGRLIQNFQRGKVTAEAVQQAREQDAPLYAQYVVLSWEGVVDAANANVEFTQANVTDFLMALARQAPNMFDEFRNFCQDPINFELPDRDAGELGKN